METFTELERRRLLTCALWLTECTAFAPTPYERTAWEYWVAGVLDLEQVQSLCAQQPELAPIQCRALALYNGY